jgi:hypothetical protein
MEDYVIRTDELDAERLLELAGTLSGPTEEMTNAVATYRQRLRAAGEVIRDSLSG